MESIVSSIGWGPLGLRGWFYGTTNAAAHTPDPRPAEDAAGRGHRRDSLFGSAYYHSGPPANFRSSHLSRDAGLVWIRSETVVLALNLVPFAGIAFLWFIGVLRDRLGASEDRFFATVFFGSGILFLAMFFAAAAVTGALIMVLDAAPKLLIESGAYIFGRAIVAKIMNVFALKMAGVFMISTATLAMRTHILPSLDNPPGLCPGGAAPVEQPLCRLVAPGVSAVGARHEHIHPDR